MSKTQVQKWAQQMLQLPNFYVIDTETTGVGKNDEIIQIGILDKNGMTIMNTLVKATVPVSRSAARVNGITDAMLHDAPTFADVYVELSTKLAGVPLVAYNMNFDWRMLVQSATRFNLPPMRTGKRHCAMQKYALYRGGIRWQKLTNACTYHRIKVENAHDALGDSRMTLALIQTMSAGK